MKKKFLVMCAVLAMAVGSLAGCGGSSSKVEIPKLEESSNVKVQKKTFEFTDGFTKVAANGNYELSVDEAFNVVHLKQVSTGVVWSTAMEADGDEKVKSADQALFKFSYYNSDNKEAAPANKDSSKLKANATYAIKDSAGNDIGMRVEYKDRTLSVGITLDLYLTEKGMEVRLPVASVEEEGPYKIISIDMMQNLTAAKNTDEGYYLYPDGSGAIMEFKDASHQNESSVEYKIYGDIETYKNMLGEWDEKGEDVFLPIFGAKIADKSFLGIVKKGEETASINILPKAGDGINKLWCSFTYRNRFDTVRKDKDGQEVTSNKYDTDFVDVERVVGYTMFDAGKDITYADMAVEYRNYLLKEYNAKKKNVDESIPVSVDIMMGINEEGTIRDSFKAVTTFTEAGKMVNDLKKSDIAELEVQLKGWTKNGYFTDPIQFPVNADIGGNEGLKEFLNKYQGNDGVKVSLETNLMEASADVGGYDSNTEIVVAGNYNPVTNYESTKYILSPNITAGKLNDLMDEIKDKDIAVDGLSFYSLGQYVTYNYSKENFITKSQCKMIWQDMLDKAGSTYSKLIVQGGNQYVLPYADKVTSIPYDDSGYRITTKDVPFFQIATHGIVNYTGSALNLSSDKEWEKLKWVEYGYVPYFELTYSGSEELMHTEYSELFSSTFSSWVDEATNVYKDFNANLKDVWNEYIVGHEEVQDNVFKVTYDNGKVVYVNYNDVECEVDGNVIEKNSYLVK